MGYGLPYFLSFLLFWAINLYFVLAGTESIKWLETLSAPFLIITGLALLGWAAGKVGGIGTILERADALRPATARASLFGVFVPRLTAESRSPLLGIVAMVAILVATLTTNIAANIVAPANGFANLAPRRVSFRLGGVIAAAIGIIIFPWKLLDMYQAWLITYSGLLGAVGGVIMCDYLVIRRGVLSLRDLYTEGGTYAYVDGVNRHAVVALVAGVVVALAGLTHPGLRFLFDGAWFSATATSFVVYWFLMRNAEVGTRN